MVEYTNLEREILGLIPTSSDMTEKLAGRLKL